MQENKLIETPKQANKKETKLCSKGTSQHWKINPKWKCCWKLTSAPPDWLAQWLDQPMDSQRGCGAKCNCQSHGLNHHNPEWDKWLQISGEKLAWAQGCLVRVRWQEWIYKELVRRKNIWKAGHHCHCSHYHHCHLPPHLCPHHCQHLTWPKNDTWEEEACQLEQQQQQQKTQVFVTSNR